MCCRACHRLLTSSVWSEQGRLRLSKSQKDDIGKIYEHHVQAEAFLQEDCLAIAIKLQVAPLCLLDHSVS